MVETRARIRTRARPVTSLAAPGTSPEVHQVHSRRETLDASSVKRKRCAHLLTHTHARARVNIRPYICKCVWLRAPNTLSTPCTGRRSSLPFSFILIFLLVVKSLNETIYEPKRESNCWIQFFRRSSTVALRKAGAN